jgi:hypothetical protein
MCVSLILVVDEKDAHLERDLNVYVCVYRAHAIAQVDAGVLFFGHLSHDKRQALGHLVGCVARNLSLSDRRYEEAHGEVGREARTGGVLV